MKTYWSFAMLAISPEGKPDTIFYSGMHKDSWKELEGTYDKDGWYLKKAVNIKSHIKW